MGMKHYTDNNGKFIGTFEMHRDKEGNEPDHPDVPAGAQEVPKAPDDARQIWNGSDYDPVSAADLDAEKETAATELADPKKAFAAVLELLWDNSAELQAAFPNPNGQNKFKQAAIAVYKAKL